MLKFLFLLLVSFDLFADTLILEKTFKKDLAEHECRIYLEGHMEALSFDADRTAIGFSRILSPLSIYTLRILNRLAIKGKIQESLPLCHQGSTVLKGYEGESEVEVDTNIECGVQRSNQSPAAQVLRNMAKDICDF